MGLGDEYDNITGDAETYTSGIIHYENTEGADALPLMADSGIIQEDQAAFESADRPEVVYDIREALFDTHEDFVQELADGERVLELEIKDDYRKADIKITSNRGIIIDVRYAGEDPQGTPTDYPSLLIERAEPRTTSYYDLHTSELARGEGDRNTDINELQWAASQFTKHMVRYWGRESVDAATLAQIPHVQQRPGPQQSMLTVTTGLAQNGDNPYAIVSFERGVNGEDLSNYATHARHTEPGVVFVVRYYKMSYSVDPALGMLQCSIEQGFIDLEHKAHKTYVESRYITPDDESEFRTFLYTQRLQ